MSNLLARLGWLRLAVVGALAGLLVAEIIALALRTTLISEVVRRDARSFLAFPFAYGVFGGHFYGPPFQRFAWWTPIPIAVLCAGLLAWDIARSSEVPLATLPVMLIAGYLLGSTLWAQ